MIFSVMIPSKTLTHPRIVRKRAHPIQYLKVIFLTISMMIREISWKPLKMSMMQDNLPPRWMDLQVQRENLRE